MIKLSIYNLIALPLLSLVLFLLLVSSVSANTVVRSGETVSIAEDSVVDGDLYTAAGTVNLSGVVEEDLVAAAGKMTLNGVVNSNAFLVGGTVDIHGLIGDDLRILAGEVTIADEVTGDLFIIGGSVRILSTASITGDILVYASDVEIAGSVGGDVLGAVEKMRIDSSVAGDINITVGNLTLGDRADVQGSVKYSSRIPVVKALNASVAGEIIRNDPVLKNDEGVRIVWFVPTLVLLFSALAWFLVSRKSLNAVVDNSLKRTLVSAMFGLVGIILLPIATTILFLSMIGGVVALTIMSLTFCLGLLSIIGFVAVLGQLILKMFNKSTAKVSLLSLLVGITSTIILFMLPVIGPVIVLGLIIITFGSMLDILRQFILK